MRTITLDILNEKALDLLRDLEMLKVIRLRRNNAVDHNSPNKELILKYKGTMKKQSIEEIDRQLNYLRS